VHPKTPDQIVAVVLIDIAVIVVVARLMGTLARRLRQPAVVGEIIAGLLLGPSLLGKFPHDPSLGLFPMVVRPYLNVVAQIGLVIFMFIVGLELDLNLVRGRERTAMTTSLSSIALPFGLGLLLASFIHSQHDHVAGKLVHFWPFALFVGASMSITAFPVLARMLSERGMQRTELGSIALACASVDDVLAWSILAVVIAVVNSTGFAGVPKVIGEAIAFVVFMFVVVRPLLRRLGDAYRRAGRLTPNMLAVVMAGFLAASFVTEEIGLHQIFGAFIFGVIMPREDTAGMVREILERLEQVSLLLLLPVFFVVTGLGANVTSLGHDGLLVLLGVLAVAISGKFVGATAAARLQGLSGHRARALGVLMNNRGLTELVILNVGVSLKVLDQSLFTILVLMAVITTIMTEPLLRLVYPQKVLEREIAEAERASLGLVDAYRVVAAIEEPRREEGLVDVGTAILGDEIPAELLLSRFTERGEALEIGSGLAIDLAQVASGLTEMEELTGRAEAAGVHAVVRAQSTDDLVRALLSQVETVEGDVLLVPVDLTSRVKPSEPAADRLTREVPSTVALLADPTGAGIRHGEKVVVNPGHGSDGEVALELGIRITRSIGGSLVLVAGDRRHARRFEQLARTLETAGVPTAVEVGEHGGDEEGREGEGTSADRSELAELTELTELAELAELTERPKLTVAGLSGLDTHLGASSATRELAEAKRGPVLVVRAGQGEIGEGLNHLLARLGSHPTAQATSADATPAVGTPAPEDRNTSATPTEVGG